MAADWKGSYPLCPFSSLIFVVDGDDKGALGSYFLRCFGGIVDGIVRWVGCCFLLTMASAISIIPPVEMYKFLREKDGR